VGTETDRGIGRKKIARAEARLGLAARQIVVNLTLARGAKNGHSEASRIMTGSGKMQGRTSMFKLVYIRISRAISSDRAKSAILLRMLPVQLLRMHGSLSVFPLRIRPRLEEQKPKAAQGADASENRKAFRPPGFRNYADRDRPTG
jgi:hypothetical protein